MEMPIHRILVERDEDIDLVTHIANRFVSGTNGQEGMTAANDRLISVVGVEMESASRKDERENIAGRRNPLAVFTADADSEVDFVHSAGPRFCSCARKFAVPGTNKQAKARTLKYSSQVRHCRPPRPVAQRPTTRGMGEGNESRC